MNKELRKAVIAGNWKMDKSPEEIKALLAEVASLVKDVAYEVVACVPLIDLLAAVEVARGTNIKIGAQNCRWEEGDAFTGKIATNMLTFIGASYIIIGHNEHCAYFGEINQTVNQRVRAMLDAGLSVILCVGKILEQREQGITEELVALQTKTALLDVAKGELTRVIIAYEPIWAIGTDRIAISARTGEVCRAIRSVIATLCDKQTADAFTTQYGGPMNAKNTVELLAQGDMDGGLIGDVSLKTVNFAETVRAAPEG